MIGASSPVVSISPRLPRVNTVDLFFNGVLLVKKLKYR